MFTRGKNVYQGAKYLPRSKIFTREQVQNANTKCQIVAQFSDLSRNLRDNNKKKQKIIKKTVNEIKLKYF